jgi:hypothetical protein
VYGAAAAADTPLPSLLPTPAATADAPIVSPPPPSSVPAELPPPLVTGQPTSQPVNPPTSDPHAGTPPANPLPATPDTPPPADKPAEPQGDPHAGAPPQQQPVPSKTQQNTACSACQQPQVDTKWHDDHHGPCEDWWLDAGYRALWIKDMRFQSTLVTSNGATLFGNQDVSFDTFNGVYANVGLWLNCRRTVGIEFNGFFVDRQDVVQTFASDATGAPAITRPITDALRLAPVNVIVSSPGVASGSVTVDSASRLSSAGVNGVWNVMQCDNYSVNALYGFRYIDLEESVDIAQSSTPLNGGAFSFGGAPLPAGVGLSLADDFHTRNQFYGGLAGTRGEWRLGPLFVGGLSTISFGPDHQTTEITGLTTPLAGGFQPLRGGLLAVGGGSAPVIAPNGQIAALVQQGNINRYTTNRFIIAPEVGAELGIYVTNGLRLGVAYNFLYMSDVARPNRQIDTRVNQRFVPASPGFGAGAGQPLPLFPVSQEDFHAHAVTFTAEVRW